MASSVIRPVLPLPSVPSAAASKPLLLCTRTWRCSSLACCAVYNCIACPVAWSARAGSPGPRATVSKAVRRRRRHEAWPCKSSVLRFCLRARTGRRPGRAALRFSRGAPQLRAQIRRAELHKFAYFSHCLAEVANTKTRCLAGCLKFRSSPMRNLDWERHCSTPEEEPE